MAFLNFLLATAALLISTIEAQQTYAPVTGKCSDLEGLHNPDAQYECGAGNWFVQWASFSGAACVYGYSLKRGNVEYGDMHMVPEGKESASDVVFMKNDLTYDPDKKTYTDILGAESFVVTIDLERNVLFAQCKEEDGVTQMSMTFATRTPEFTDENKEVYEKYSKKLEEKGLLPKMTEIKHHNCPEINNVALQ